MRWHRPISSPSHGARSTKQLPLWSHPRLLTYCAVFLASFFALVFNIIEIYLSRSRSSNTTLAAISKTDISSLLPNSLEREERAAHQLGIRLTKFSSHSAYLLCPKCALDNDPPQYPLSSHNPPKIVALIELRNVAESIDSFLAAIERVVDGVVALDDHSDDETRALLLERCLSAGSHSSGCKLDALIVKNGEWIRQEVSDRNLLLRAGRSVGGTHFVLLDYDERFVGDCVNNGALRNAVVSLPPGHSLFLPWAELWKHPNIHRVLPTDRNINFLVRRQAVVFADNGKTNYSMESSRARSLGIHNASIHALRCPRSICPQPPRYRGPTTSSISDDPRVHHGPSGCAVAEARFMHIPNVMLKAAWYQGLSRVLGADSSTTRGKMLDVLFPAEAPSDDAMRRRLASGYSRSGISISIAPTSWFSFATVQKILSLRHIENWRAKELVDWLDRLGDAQFSDLSALQYFDLNNLRHATAKAFFPLSVLPWYHAPRWKRGTLVIAVESHQVDSLCQVLQHFGESTEVVPGEISMYSDFLLGREHNRTRKNLDDNILGYEDWRLSMINKVRVALSKSTNGVAYISTAGLSVGHFKSLVELTSKELDQFDVVFLFAVDSSEETVKDEERKLEYAVSASIMAGSHIRVLAVDSAALGSYSAVTWLQYRITGNRSFSRMSEQNELLSLTERINAQLRSKPSIDVLPVARMIFSLNVGRSGSKYLAGIFSSLGRVIRGLHEPRCPGNKCSGGGAMAMQHKNLNDTYSERRSIKVGMLESEITEMSDEGVKEAVEAESVGHGTCEELVRRQVLKEGGARTVMESNSVMGCTGGRLKDYVYTETNPNFKSWFYDVTLDTMPVRGYKVSVLVLRKYHAAALKSLYETGYFTSRNGYNWMETGNSVNSQLRAIASDAEMDAFDKIISYLLNAEVVTRHVMRKYATVAEFVEARSEEIYSAGGALKLLRQLGLSESFVSASTLELVGKRSDKYGTGPTQAKRRLVTSIDECERRITRYLASCASIRISQVPQNMSQLARYHGFPYT